ncbi:hypothetical protein F4805DRAFT_474438 [Annulohypoxylon moriforme]|nr:hypothetical protein F4805DRAFT_474438 [Annulohypoxylon moriforme]
MATAVTTSVLQSDLEKGQIEPDRTRMTNYVQDITRKYIPFCIGFLIVLSIGAILVITLDFHEVIPRKEIIVVSIMLLVFFVLYCIGRVFLYHRKRYPPLTKGPNAPDRPPPKDKTWKDRASVIGTLTIGKFKLGKILHYHHEITPAVHPQGVPDNPTELPSSTLAHRQQTPQQPCNVHSSNTTENQRLPGYGLKDKDQFVQLNKKPVRRVPIKGHHHSPLRNSYTPSEEAIPEAPEQNEQDYIPNDSNGVSPLSRKSGRRFAPYSPGARMTGAKGGSRVLNDSSQSPQALHAPGTRRTSRDYPLEELQPRPKDVRLNIDNTEPLANLLYLPENISNRAFAEALPDNYLYIIDNQPSEPDGEAEIAKSSCRCECKNYNIKKLRSQAHEPRADKNATYIDVPRGSGIEITAPEASKVQDHQNLENLSYENDGPDTAHPASIPRHPSAEPQQHERRKKARATSSRQKDDRPIILDNHMEFPDQCPPAELPSAPPKTKPPPSRRNPESLLTQEDLRKYQSYTSSDAFRYGKESNTRPLNRSWGQRQIPRKRERRANTMTEGYTKKRRAPPRSIEKEELDAHPGASLRGTDHYPPPVIYIPQRGSSRGFSDVYGTVSRSASEERNSNSSVSSDSQQHE